MKNLFILGFLFLSAGSMQAQTTSNSAMGQEFNNLVKVGGGGTAAFQAYSNSQIDGSQFFFPDWEQGEVVNNNKEAFSKGYLFVYDKVRQELFIRQGAATEILQGNKEDIRSFKLNDGDKQFSFVNSAIFGKVTPEVFYQVLIDNPTDDSSKISLYKFINGKLVKANRTDMASQMEGKVNDAFVDTYEYYIMKGTGTLEPVQLKTKSLKKAMIAINADPDKYMNEHPGAVNEEYLVTMIRELNSK